MLLPTYTQKSAKPTTTKVSDEIFAAKSNPALVSQAIRVYLSNQRQGTKHAKTRGEVHGTGKKIYRQKGTGRARHGDRLAPIFVKGGVAHGPKGNENYTKKLPRSFRKQALINALSTKTKAKQVLVIDSLTKIAKTKDLDAILRQVQEAHGNSSKTLALIVETTANPLARYAKNLANTTAISADKLTTYQAIRHGLLMFVKDSLPVIEARLKSK